MALKKRYLLLIGLAVLSLSNFQANAQTKPKPSTKTVIPQKKVIVSDSKPNHEVAKLLISKSDCLTCHQMEGDLIGPSYKEVANKYEANKANILYLSTKIKNGGKGVWGDAVMMPHPDLTIEQTQLIAAYILSLR
jgi:cytochrome c